MTVNYIITMKGAKSSGKVSKSSFFDRIRTHTRQADSKQNIDINHIRQSSYKLERSKSHRTEHSLERKVPIVPFFRETSEKQHEKGEGKSGNFSNCFSSKIKIQHCLKENEKWHENTINNYAQEDVSFSNKTKSIKNVQNKESNMVERSISHHLGKNNNFDEFIDLLKMINEEPHLEFSPFEPVSLKEEQLCLELIKTMFQNVTKMKQKNILREQAYKIQKILKNLIIKLARPKLQIFQSESSLSLNVPPFTYSPFDNFMSIKQSNQESSDNLRQKCQQIVESHQNSKNYIKEEVPTEELEFRKIMYILEQSKKHQFHKNVNKKQQAFSSVEVDEIQVSSSQGEPFRETVSNKFSTFEVQKSFVSSFNSHVSEVSNSSKALVYQQQKMNSSCSNNKLFLKNIVKKVKSNKENVDGKLYNPSDIIFNSKYLSKLKENSKGKIMIQAEAKPMTKGNDCDITVFKNISSINSDQHEQITEESEQYCSLTVSQTSEQGTFVQESRDSVKPLDEDSSQRQSQEGDSVSVSESESKRTTLNNIINMLNQRYNKNLKLEPRKIVKKV